MRSSTKIGIGTALVFGVSYFGYQAFAAFQVDRIVFQDLKPGAFNLVGVNTGRGFKIIVSNEVAQLVEFDPEKEKGFEGETGEEADVTNKRRVPLKDMLLSLQGDEQAAGKLVVSLNDTLRKQELPANEVLWKASELRKALDGDAVLKKKLEEDLNVTLDGQPLDKIRPASLQNGIVVEGYLPLKANIEGKPVTLQAPVRQPFTARFAENVRKHYESNFNPSKEVITGFYLEEATKLKSRPGDVQDVRKGLENLIDQDNLTRQFGDAPNRILNNSQIVITEKFFNDVSLTTREVSGGKQVCDIHLDLNDEGRKRLWQYSRRNPGKQLLFIGLDGLAIAAPRIGSEMAEPRQTIKNVQNPTLAQEVVASIKTLISSKS